MDAMTPPAEAGRPENRQDVERLMAQHEQGLLRYAGRLLRDASAAQEVVQDAFLRYLRRQEPLEAGVSTGAWLYRVAHNLAVDYIRREQRRRAWHAAQHAESLAQAPTWRENPGREQAERLQAVLAHLDQLTLNERQVLLLRLQEGLSYKEIAAATGQTEGNVGFLLHQAVKKMSHTLQRAGIG